jgi:enoyl-CoA hydratase/carnithine racemase
MAMSWKLREGEGYARVKQSRDGAVGILILNEPASLNAMTPDLLGGLATAIGELTADPTIRSLVLDRRGARLLLGPEFAKPPRRSVRTSLPA